jgi:hypothetical protein
MSTTLPSAEPRLDQTDAQLYKEWSDNKKQQVVVQQDNSTDTKSVPRIDTAVVVVTKETASSDSQPV